MTAAGTQRKLDITRSSKLYSQLAEGFAKRVVGQREATQALLDIVESHQAGYSDSSRPAGVVLFLGPTGTGKTLVAETLAATMLGSKRACLRIDCSEFAHSHEIAKLIGSPPGYLGHRETSPLLTQEALDKYHSPDMKLSIVLFDEIEKASDTLWALLLGILDNATLTLGDNRKVDFSKVIIVMTSNLGAREMANRGIGFVEPTGENDEDRLEKIAISAAKSKFSPEFMNRLQSIVVFKSLTEENIARILEIELLELGMRLYMANLASSVFFSIAMSPKAKRTLLDEGYSKAYGARYLKRVIEKRVQQPLARLFSSGQITEGDTIIIDDAGEKDFTFYAQGRLL